MARKKLIRQNQFPYHVTTRTNNKTWFQIPIFEVWDICKDSLIYALKQEPVVIHCFVLMGNHYHLLISTPSENIDKFMKLFNLKLSLLISKKSGVINHKFSNRYGWTIVNNHSYLLNVYRYIYQNPVRAGLVKGSFDYPYSSLHFSSYESRLFCHKPHFHYKREKYWIERRYGEDFDRIIRNSLSRQTFQTNNRISVFHKKILENPKKISY